MTQESAANGPGEIGLEAPGALGETIVRCLATQPEARPASAAILARELAASIGEPVAEPLPEATGILAVDVLPAATAAAPPLDTRSRGPARRLVVVAAAVTLLALALISAISFTDLGSNNPATPQLPSAAAVEEIAIVRGAIDGAASGGELDATGAQDLTHRLDAIKTFVTSDKIEQAARKTVDMLGRLDDLARQAGRITVAATARIREPLKQLATILAAPGGG